MQAVVKTGGKQYKVANGDVVVVEKLAGNAGDTILLEDVLAVVDGDKLELKTEKAKVAAEIIEQGKGDKVLIFKKKRRHTYRRLKGHRQEQTVLRIADIALDGNVKAKAAAKSAAKKDAKPEAKKAPAKKPATKAAAEKKPAAKKPAAKKAPAKKPAAKKDSK